MTTDEKRSRAAPRKAKKDPDEAPLFLQKTFQMVDTVGPVVYLFFQTKKSADTWCSCFHIFVLVATRNRIMDGEWGHLRCKEFGGVL
jgi:hypothetical protein